MPLLGLLAGFVLVLWSADRFVEWAAATPSQAGVPPLLVGMLIVGLGTSAPEMVVSALAVADGSPDLALGNALGSNITNTGLILGLTALISPISVHSKVVRREIPILLAISLIVGLLLSDGVLARVEACGLLLGFFCLIGWTCVPGFAMKPIVLPVRLIRNSPLTR